MGYKSAQPAAPGAGYQHGTSAALGGIHPMFERGAEEVDGKIMGLGGPALADLGRGGQAVTNNRTLRANLAKRNQRMQTATTTLKQLTNSMHTAQMTVIHNTHNEMRSNTTAVQTLAKNIETLSQEKPVVQVQPSTVNIQLDKDRWAKALIEWQDVHNNPMRIS
jgi:hypothetical protein